MLSNTTITAFLQAITSVLAILLPLASFSYFLLSAFRWITSGGDVKALNSSRAGLSYSIILFTISTAFTALVVIFTNLAPLILPIITAVLSIIIIGLVIFYLRERLEHRREKRLQDRLRRISQEDLWILETIEAELDQLIEIEEKPGVAP